MAEGIQIKNLPSTTAIKQGDTMTIVQDKQNKQLSLDVFANESDLATLSPLENRCDEVKAKIEVDEYSAEITTSQSMSEIGSDDNGANLHENVLDGAYESCVLKGKTKYIDNDTQEILDTFQDGRNLSLIENALVEGDGLEYQLEVGTVATPYEPYKTSILSFNQKDDKTIVLRSLPDGTCDTLNVETGEYVQKIGERNYQDGDTNSNTLVTDGTKTHYKLSSPITTKVDVQGFPHAYKNGHIQLSSGSTEPSLTPTVTYKVPVSRVGQIASNTKSNLRQTIKLDQLEILAYQSLINAEYENLLVQNSAESAASFTNLSTNDPKDELYYMLKHLIEEDQPVQNMLDKINLFYLYGLLSDEHYFDLLLGGEEDVY